jgi:hypothetical protein
VSVIKNIYSKGGTNSVNPRRSPVTGFQGCHCDNLVTKCFGGSESEYRVRNCRFYT